MWRTSLYCHNGSISAGAISGPGDVKDGADVFFRNQGKVFCHSGGRGQGDYKGFRGTGRKDPEKAF